jgi:hypothetical protein
MRFFKNIFASRMRFILIVLPVILMFLISPEIKAQEPPPRPVTVTVTGQNLSFGAFYHGPVGGTVTINSGGSRSATGDVILLNLGYSYSTALYQLVANPGTVISLLNGPDVSLPGSPGGSMSLHIGDSDLGPTFVITSVPPAFTLLNIGGTITVSNPGSNPPGSYSGTFDITFVQE